MTSTAETGIAFGGAGEKGVCFVLFLLAVGLVWMEDGCRPRVAKTGDDVEQAEEKVVRVFNWSDYIDPETIVRFEKQTGIHVELTTFDTQDELIGRVRSTRTPFDVVVVEDAILGLFCELKLLRELDLDKIPNRKNLKSEFTRRPPDPGQLYSMPYHWGTTLLAYRRDRTEDLPATWAVLWDERFATRIWMLQDVNEVLAIAGIYARHRGDASMQQAWDLALAQSRLVGRYADTLSIADGLLTGECDIGVLYSGDAARAAARNTNIVYVIPEEGARLWVDNFCILRDAEHVDAAHRFINFMLDGAIAAMNANYVRFASPNAAAVAEMDPAILNDLQLNPLPIVIERCVFCPKPNADLLIWHDRLWAYLSKLPAWKGEKKTGSVQSNAGEHVSTVHEAR